MFAALADKNRRKLVELLHQQDSTLLELAPHFDMSFQALSKHIKILERAHVLSKQQQGKYRVLSLNRAALQQSLQWITTYSNFWTGSFDKLSALIDENRQRDGA